MNLGKLLATGRSIMNGRAGVAYRENKHVYLPKFEPAKNLPGKPAGFNAATPAAAAAGAPVKLSVTAPAAPRPAGRPAARREVRADGWSAWLNPMARLSSAVAGPQRSVTAVQTELSLDAVKVLHNDLCDADAEVEVVPLKSRPARVTGAAEAEPAAAWSELGNSLFEANAV